MKIDGKMLLAMLDSAIEVVEELRDDPLRGHNEKERLNAKVEGMDAARGFVKHLMGENNAG